MIETAALAATVWIIYAYARSVRTDRLPFHRANAVGAIPIMAAAAMAGSWATIPLTMAFGSIGLFGWLKARGLW